ncbi:MAG: metallophosphoesterase family protein [Burkholderiaceae bacterium]
MNIMLTRLMIVFVSALFLSCGGSGGGSSLGADNGLAQGSGSPQPGSSESLKLAVIGDYGAPTREAQDVAALVKSWKPDFVLTVGDNNYPEGSAETIDRNVGAYYQEFIGAYKGSYGPGSQDNRFFPTPGNHDWKDGIKPYTDYFSLPGNERYYDVRLNDQTHVFALDSDPHEPHGVTSGSVQAQWLQQSLANSEACWKLILFHHAPYSSGAHGSSDWMQWQYRKWGADAVLAGHDHSYERIVRDGLPYFVNGLGGNAKYSFNAPVAGSQIRYNGDVGAMLIEIEGNSARFRFIARDGNVVDDYSVQKNCPAK